MKWLTGIGLIAVAGTLLVALLSHMHVSGAEDASQQVENPVETEIRRLIWSADSIRVEQKVESAILLMGTAVEFMEHEGEKFDSLRAYALMRLGRFYAHQGLCVEAIQCCSQCLDLNGKEHWLGASTVAAVIRQMGASYGYLGHYYEADSLVRESIARIESTSEPDSLELVRCLSVLGRFSRIQLRYEESETSFNRALAICRGLDLGPRRPRSLEASIRGRLGDLYFEQGKLAEAEFQYRQALDLADDPKLRSRQRLSEYLDDLGKLYEEKTLYEDAESYFRQALQIREEELGLTHPWLIYHLLNLASVQISRENFPEAASNCFLSLGVIEKAGYGLRHPQRARAKRILGDSYRGRGKCREAEKFYREAVDICKQLFGQYHPELTRSLEGLALLYASTGDSVRTAETYEELLRSRHRLLRRVFYSTSEAQKIRYADMYHPLDYSLFSLALSVPSDALRILALEMTLKGKAVMLDALAKEHEFASLSDDPDAKRVWDQLQAAKEKLPSFPVITEETEILSEQSADGLNRQERTLDSLEAELGKYVPFNLLLAEFEATDIANLVPQEGVLWEFVYYRPFDVARLRSDPKALGDPRYLAFTLERSGRITLTDLGEAHRIDSLINLVRDQISLHRSVARADTSGRLERQLQVETGKLYDLVFAPVEAKIGVKTEILVSPDGQLNLLPLEILTCPDGRYVIEKFEISYLSSGRDLLKYEMKRRETGPALVIANPDFDSCQGSVSDQASGALGERQSRPVGPEYLVPFDQLYETEREAASICSTIRDRAGLRVDSYTGGEAREEVLKNITSAPKILHIATHGFFRKDANGRPFRNPLLRCGLAFTGANCWLWGDLWDESQAEPGILTAFEASSLNLVGTELVTLSACETGVGEVRNGEGVYGLTRSFQHAGARTIVMSLWKVRAEETRELMVHFYRSWLTGKRKKEALREAALEVMKSCRAKYGNAHPYFWGAFVLVGDPN